MVNEKKKFISEVDLKSLPLHVPHV